MFMDSFNSDVYGRLPSLSARAHFHDDLKHFVEMEPPKTFASGRWSRIRMDIVKLRT